MRKILANLDRAQLRQHAKVMVLSSLLTTGGVFLLELLGLFQLPELAVFDWLVQRRPTEAPDARIVVVGVTEQDLQKLGTGQLPDAAVAELLQRIQQQRPRVVGLDYYRNLPTEPGHQALRDVFASMPNLIGIQKVISQGPAGSIPGNEILVRADQVAASDILPDGDSRVRRGLLFPTLDEPNPLPGLSLRLALEYLQQEGITPDRNAHYLTLNGVVFPRLKRHAGGYVNIDTGGYQILLNLRQNRRPFVQVSLMDVLDGKIPPDLMRDRIVLIGSTAAADSDLFFVARPDPVYGVELHAHLTSQIISTAMDGRPLMQGWSLLVSGLGVFMVALVVSGITLLQPTYVQKVGGTVGVLGLVWVGSFGLLLLGWWVPVVLLSTSAIAAHLLMMAQSTRSLNTLATKDELTQIANRRMFNQRLDDSWRRATRSRQPVSLILCDVDYFKRYNDTYGHQEGDVCLQAVAAALARVVKRTGSLVARYGGEEFVVLLPKTSAEQALWVAKSAHSAIQNLRLPHKASDVSKFVTMSFGVSTLVPEPDATADLLVSYSDLALYEAKRRGRNQVVTYNIEDSSVSEQPL